jgi:hypothetical protein
LFNRRKKTDGSEPYNNGVPSPAYADLLSRYLGPARQHQLTFGREITDAARWSVDFRAGTIGFDERTFPLQFVGSESQVSGTWLWGVENVNGFPDHILQAVNQFYNQCVLAGVPDLARTKLPLTEAVQGHAISSIMAAMANPPYCYYRCPYEGGAAFVLVGGVPESVFAPVGVDETVEVIMDLLEQYPLDHRTLAKAMLEKNAVSVVEGGEPVAGSGSEQFEAMQGVATVSSLIGTFRDGRTLELRFDQAGRIAHLAYDPAAD